MLVVILSFLYFREREVNDYYEYVNYDTLKVNHLGDGKHQWSYFTISQDKADLKVDQIVQDILMGNTHHLSDMTRDNMKIVYQNALDFSQRKEVGLGPLTEYIDEMMNSQDISEFQKNGIKIEKDLGVNIFSNLVIEKDYLDHKKNIVYFYPITLAFGSGTYIFVKDDYMGYKAYIKRAMNQIFQLYGYDKKESSGLTNQLISFYEELGRYSLSFEYLEDVSNYYHMIDLQTLASDYSHLELTNYLVDRLGEVNDSYSVVDEGQIRFLNEYMTDEHLDVWKYYCLMQVLSNYADYLDSDYEDIVIRLNQAIVGNIKNESDEDKARSIVSSIFSSEIDEVFAREVMRDEDRLYLNRLFLEIKDVYRDMLKNNTWLCEETIEKAIVKLQDMDIVIGDFKYDGIGDEVVFSRDGLIYNIISFQQLMWKKELERLHNSNDSRVMADSVVNAYYRPQNNSVIIPSAFLYLIQDNDEFSKLGSIGMILAHEITHGFDGNGSKFDQDGNYVDWWTDKDRELFLKLQKEVSDYYSEYEVLNGRHIDGERTVNENIADLGALNAIVGIAEKRGASQDEFKKMFASFAALWASEEDEHYMKLLLLTDTHSPNKYRVNAVLSSLDKFYEVYYIPFWSDMYRSPKDRVKVW